MGDSDAQLAEQRKREHKRVAADIPVVVRSLDGDRREEQRIRNISLGGMFITMEKPLSFGDDVVLAFKLPDSDTELTCRGFVVWSTIDRPLDTNESGVGVRLFQMGIQEMRRLAEYIESQLDGLD